MSSWLRGSWVVLLVAVVVGGAGCQWDVPLDPFIDSGLDASDPDAGTDGATDAPTDGMPMATLTVIRNGTASGTVTSNTVGAGMIDCGATCTAQFPPGTLITLTETPGTGATFAGWSGVCTDTSPNCSFTLDSDTTVQATFDISRHTITIAPGGNGVGSVTSNVGGINCPGTCEATVDYGTSLMLTATPVAPSIFAGWNDVGCTGTTPCTFTVTQDETIDAPFALNYTVTVSKNGNGSGTVTSAPAGIDCGSDCNQVYSAGTMVTLTAAAAADSDFVGWGGACTGTGSCMVTVNALVSVTANFALKRYTLTSTRSGTGGGVVTSNPVGINCGTDCDELYDHGTQVTLTAMADGSSTFTAWSEAGCTGTGACVVTLTGARSVGATFTLNRYQLTVAKSGNGASLGTVSSTPVGINCGADCDELYDANTMVTLSASTMSGASFMGWSGACTGTGNCVVTMSGAQNVTAMFALNQFTLSVNKAGNGAGRGTVTSSPAGISCGAMCSAGYQFGQSVTLTPTAMSGASFTGWSGGGCSGVGNCVVTIGGDTAVTATFELDTYTLAVVRAGNAASTGSVTSAPAGITCNAAMNDCDQGYVFGTAVTLTAAAGAGSTFAGWSGGGCTGTGTCTVTVDAATTVTATFTLDEALTVTKAGAGAPYGTVASAPAGINCGNDCSENFGVGTMVTLTATVQAGAATFAGWSGACAGTQASCVVTVAAATNAVATFDLVPHVLTAARAGDGSGSIESNVAGINCGADCTEPYGYGTTVVLTATPDAGATFTGWSGGGCGGTGSCSVTVTAATTVTATFQADRVLTVSTAGNGGGSVASAPGGINCPGDCMETYTHGQMVTLTATPLTGSTFTSWSGGGCAGTSPCTVTMTAARNVQATFTLTSHTLTVAKAGSGQALGTVMSMPAGINCGGDCTETVNYGTQLTLAASAAAGATFVGWSGGGCNGTGMCVVTVTANTMVTANFEADKTLTVSRAGTGSTYGLVTATGINCGNDCTEPYAHDSFVELTASVPVAAAATFGGWSGGGCAGAQATCTVRMDMAQMVTATFDIRQHTVSVATNGGNGAGTVASTPMGIMAPATPSASFNYGTTVTLAASPSTGSNFTGWSGVSGCSGTGSCDVLVDGAKAVTATFTLQQFALSASKTGTSTALATVTSTPAGINCGGTCSSMFNYNTPVQLSVSLMPGVTFLGWSGETCSGTGTCSVTMTQARNVSAAFEGDKVLSVTVNGNGSGSVVSAPAGIMTPAMTSASFPYNTPVTLTAAANTTTSNFAGWGGACTSAGMDPQCVVTMSAARNVTATFTLKTYTLTVNKSGAGVGTVTSTPAGVNCGTACSTQNATYNHGDSVALSHLAGVDSEFVTWGGSCSGASCSVTMVTDRTVTANFKRTDKTLMVGLDGTGTGSVTSNPAGINAPTDGSETYTHGTPVTLTATANPMTSDFAGWDGDGCSGLTPVCTVTMSQARAVTATFTLKTYTLTINKTGAGSGTVTSNIGGVNCGPACSTQSVTLTHGQTATLSQSAAIDANFVQWGGACGGSGACSITMTDDETITAEFSKLYLVAINVLGSGSGSVTVQPGNFTCSSSMCTRYYDAGLDLSISATPTTSTDWFSGFSGACTGTSTCSINDLDAMKTINATFVPSYTVGGSVSGLWTGANLVLQLQPVGWPSQQVQVSAEGAFTFAGRVPANTDFTLSVASQPGQHTCTVQNPSGTVTTANIANLSVTCTSTIGVSIALLGPDPFTFDPQQTTQALSLSVMESEMRLLLDGPAGSSAQMNGMPLAYLVTSSPVSLSSGSNVISVAFVVGSLTRTYQIVLNRGTAPVSQAAYIKPPVRDPNDRFGYASAGYANRIIVGAPFEDSVSTASATNNGSADSGAAYIFRRDGQAWTLEQYVKASDVTSGQLFGRAVDIDKDVAVVGGPSVGTGAAYVFRRVGSTWTQEARLTASDAANGMNFGNAVAVHGSVIAVAAQYESEAPTSLNGAVYIFRYAAGQWTQETVLRAPNRDSFDYFGWSIDLESSRIIVGAVGEDSNVTGASTVTSSDNSAIDSGAAYVFAWSGASWNFEGYLKASNTEPSDEYGTSVSIDDDVAVATAPAEDSGGSPADNGTSQAGAAYVYRRSGNTWSLEAYIKPPAPRTNGNFGADAAIRDGALIVGESQPNAVTNPGNAYVYRYTAGSWPLTATLSASNAENGDKFGHSVDAIAEGGVVCAEAEDGNPGPSDNNASSAGACYAFR